MTTTNGKVSGVTPAVREVRIGKTVFRLPFSGEIPTPSEDDRKRLRASIKGHKKVLVPILVDGPGNVIDGEARLLIAVEEGLPPTAVPIRVEHTRNLEESRKLCREIPNLEERTGRDGKKQSAKKRSAKKAASAAPKDQLGQPIPDALRDAFADTALPTAIEWLRCLLAELGTRRHLNGLTRRNGTYPFLDLMRFIDCLSEMQRQGELALAALEAGRAEVVCQCCTAMGCTNCRNSGHMPLWRHEDLVHQGLV
jgi:hypothetical protein